MQDRRKIEKEAFSGNLLGIVATNALELGVDIGVLDAVIMLGFPIGGLASFVSDDQDLKVRVLKHVNKASASRESRTTSKGRSGSVCR